MKTKLKKKFWVTLILFSLVGQVAWVVENMYFNVFIYKMFHASASQISFMVGASAVAATLTTLLIGALSDRVGKRKIFICTGYILWGVSILIFILLRINLLEQITGNTILAMTLGVNLVIIMDCVMTFFGSSANDACFNAWLTDSGDDTNRGSIEGVNSMMPLIAILVVFGGFMPFQLDKASSWTMIYSIIGLTVICVGIAGFFLIEDNTKKDPENCLYFKNVLYSFRISTYHKNKLLYVIIGAFAIFGISIQTFMPYLILYYEQTLGMDNYVLIMAPAIILAATITAFYGKLYDMLGFETSVIPTVITLMTGYVLLYFCRGTALVFLGSLFMMTGYLTGMAVFGAMIRDHTPVEKAGLFQGIRIFGQVFIPGIVGPAIGALVLKNAATIINSDGTSSFLPNRNIYLAAFITAVVLALVLMMIFIMMHTGHRKLTTELTEEGIPFSSYPRPQMKRESYLNLNGKWTLNNHEVIVPYPPQSDLSGYGRHVGTHLHYSRSFVLPENFNEGRVILHFGAVDQIADISVNGHQVLHHEGGYLPFEVDITDVLLADANAENLLQVHAVDTLSHAYPYGKQRKKRGGMWYTPVSGIWQTVWIESVPKQYIRSLRLLPDLESIHLKLEGDVTECTVCIHTPDGDIVTHMSSSECRIQIDGVTTDQGKKHTAILWSPENPYLYQTEILAGEDRIETYFALRTIAVRKIDGKQRICLNGKPYFLHGVLDQGYYCDGIFLPKTEEGFIQDIHAMKELGFNTLRKHIKVEPECFYYECDKIGMLVMQDMVNSGHYSFLRDTALPTLGQRTRDDSRGGGSRIRKLIFIEHTKNTIRQLYNHPCIIYYTIFNEGWGQFDSDLLYDIVAAEDRSRMIDTTSGWFRRRKSDVVSAHIYFKTPKLHKTYRPLVISECGGYSWLIPEHSYSLYSHYGYGNCMDEKELTDHIVRMYEKMVLPFIEQGLAGCVYTQLSDVEDETNGFYTYDRKICKVDKKRFLEVAGKITNGITEVGR